MSGRITDADFRLTDKGLLDQVGDRILERVAGEILSNAVAWVPIDTGNLAGSLGVDGPRAEGSLRVARVGTNVTYAPFVEFGTSRMAAQPYLGPALEDARRRYVY